MATITCLKDMTRELQVWDIVYISDIKYEVMNCYLSRRFEWDNWQIFTNLNIEDKYKFCSTQYWYETKALDRPSYKDNDMAAATRCVNSLYAISEWRLSTSSWDVAIKTVSEAKPKFKAGDKVRCLVDEWGWFYWVYRWDIWTIAYEKEWWWQKCWCVEFPWKKRNLWEKDIELVQDYNPYTRKQIDCSYTFTPWDYWHAVKTIRERAEEEYTATIPILHSKPKKTMTTLSKKLRDKFFKSTEDKIVDLVEAVEEKLEPIQELKDYLEEVINRVEETKDDISDDIDDEDKAALKADKKALENIIKEKIDTELMKKLMAVSKELVKKDE